MQLEELQPINAPTAIKIIDAAGHLFLQRGYKAVSINEIIKSAEVTKPTLYYYFADKEQLFVQMGLRVLAEMGERMCLALEAADNTAARLHALATVLMDNRDNDMRMMRHEMMAHLEPTERARMGRAFFLHIFSPIVRAMEQGLADGDLSGYPAGTLAKMFMGMSESFHEFAHQPTDSSNAQHTALFGPSNLGPAALVDLFLHGVGTASRMEP